MDDREIAMELDGRAAVVAEWLKDRFGERRCWMAGDLACAGKASWIDIASWRGHPTVARLMDQRWIDTTWGEGPQIVLPSQACLDEMAVQDCGTIAC